MFEQSLKQGKFPEIWQKPNVILVHKEEDYRPTSIRPIFSKISEIVIYNSLFNHFRETNFLFLYNQVFYLVIHVLLSIIMKYKQHLIIIQLLMWEVYFLTSQKPSKNLRHRIFYSSYNLIGLKVNFFALIVAISVSKE